MDVSLNGLEEGIFFPLFPFYTSHFFFSSLFLGEPPSINKEELGEAEGTPLDSQAVTFC